METMVTQKMIPLQVQNLQCSLPKEGVAVAETIAEEAGAEEGMGVESPLVPASFARACTGSATVGSCLKMLANVPLAGNLNLAHKDTLDKT